MDCCVEGAARDSTIPISTSVSPNKVQTTDLCDYNYAKHAHIETKTVHNTVASDDVIKSITLRYIVVLLERSTAVANTKVLVTL